ncbi:MULTISPECIES: RusA family crossover junction endodeoxyribonuclease [unclassified Microcoleus]|uniref:RusA family crossover junction endodeoxyribonuclease n=1 Tax=unclassified Microcoleus TaxID=2642155 RepID=UPI0025DD0337|nr:MULTISPECIES: RusA family crossover junction endodeoxyribonuclease [unclassified Microcoleus]
MQFEFLIPRRPVSLQTRQRRKLQDWQTFVRAEASKTWVGTPYSGNVHLTLVYLYDTDPVDTDNIIKPIQDALIGLVYEDDSLVTDVESHRRSLSDTFKIALCPLLLLDGIRSGSECVYVRISESKALESYL